MRPAAHCSRALLPIAIAARGSRQLKMPGRTQRPRRGAAAAVASQVSAEPTVVKPKRQQKPRRFGCATLTAKKPCATELVAIASAKTEATRAARQREQRAKKQALKRTEPVLDGYKTFFFQRDDLDPPYFPLRLSQKKGAEFSPQARQAILAERPKAKVAGELKAFDAYFGTDSSSVAKMKRKYGSTAITVSAPREGRPALIGSPELKVLAEHNKKMRGISCKRFAASVSGVEGAAIPGKDGRC